MWYHTLPFRCTVWLICSIHNVLTKSLKKQKKKKKSVLQRCHWCWHWGNLDILVPVCRVGWNFLHNNFSIMNDKIVKFFARKVFNVYVCLPGYATWQCDYQSVIYILCHVYIYCQVCGNINVLWKCLYYSQLFDLHLIKHKALKASTK